MENDKKITEKVLKIKGIIENKEYKIKELQNFYNNINNSKEISGKKIGLIGYGSGSKSKVFEGVVQDNWTSKMKDIKLFEYLENRTSITVKTYEKIHTSKLESPVVEASKIALNYIEKEDTNYGLRRYKVNKK